MATEATNAGRTSSVLDGPRQQSVTDEYSKLSDDMEYRREVAEKIGAAFTVPAPMIPIGT